MSTEKKLAQLQSDKANRDLVLVKAYKKAFGGSHGKVVLQDLASKCYLVSPTHLEGDQALDLARKEGMRSAMCNILAMLEKDTIDIIGLIKDTNKQMEDVRKGVDFVNTTMNDEIFTGGSDE